MNSIDIVSFSYCLLQLIRKIITEQIRSFVVNVRMKINGGNCLMQVRNGTITTMLKVNERFGNGHRVLTLFH